VTMAASKEVHILQVYDKSEDKFCDVFYGQKISTLRNQFLAWKEAESVQEEIYSFFGINKVINSKTSEEDFINTITNTEFLQQESTYNFNYVVFPIYV
jgi:hypothetical protein